MPSTDDPDRTVPGEGAGLGSRFAGLSGRFAAHGSRFTGLGGRFSAVLERVRGDPRARAGLLGIALGFSTTPVLLLAGWGTRDASNTTFALGALVLGFGVLAWVAALSMGPAIETLQEYTTFGEGWTEAGARLAFAVLSALGAGVMIGSSLATVLF